MLLPARFMLICLLGGTMSEPVQEHPNNGASHPPCDDDAHSPSHSLSDHISHHEIFPHVHADSNVRGWGDFARRVRIPGEATTFPPEGRAAAAAAALRSRGQLHGTTLEELSEGRRRGAFDSVVTPFVLDACADVLDAVRSVHRLLRPGGIWVHLGPLAYHWATAASVEDDGSESELSRRAQDDGGGELRGGGAQTRGGGAELRGGAGPRLTANELMLLIERSGFEILEAGIDSECAYGVDPLSMSRAEYTCLALVARKAAGVEEAAGASDE